MQARGSTAAPFEQAPGRPMARAQASQLAAGDAPVPVAAAGVVLRCWTVAACDPEHITHLRHPISHSLKADKLLQRLVQDCLNGLEVNPRDEASINKLFAQTTETLMRLPLI